MKNFVPGFNFTKLYINNFNISFIYLILNIKYDLLNYKNIVKKI